MDKVRECIAAGECRPRHRSKKDRHRWCGGHEGREHQWTWVDRETLPNTSQWMRTVMSRRHFITEVKFCTVCKRQEGMRKRCRFTGELVEGYLPSRCTSCGACDGPGRSLF